LQECWLRLKDLSVADKDKVFTGVLSQCHCLRHHMFHFVTVLHGYLLSQLLHTSWNELVEDLRACDLGNEASSPSTHGGGAPPASQHAAARARGGGGEGGGHRQDGAESKSATGKGVRSRDAGKPKGQGPRDLHELRCRHDAYLSIVTDRGNKF
jgi:hypothetical protein